MAKTPRPATDNGIVIGQVLQGKYRVEEILGHGGMGIVARCTHLALNEQVAVKMLRPDVLLDHDATSRFMREAQAAVKLRSEYVARVSDVGTFDNGVPYMVMEFLDGHDLGQLLERQHHVPVQWAVELVLQTAEALAEAHSIGIVHRDVKPTNLFVTWRPDGTSLIKVLDFGISKSPMGTDMQLTQTQSLLGTPAYMSPEQMRSARLVDQRTDIWSLGTVMYELLEGRRPFEADSFSEMCVKVAVDQPEPMLNTPAGLQEIVLRCLAKAPEQRYASMAELGRDLIPFARDPHQATMLVERMFRMLGRSSGASWESGSGVRAPTPGTIAPLTLKDHSAPAVVPVEMRPKRSRAPMVIGFAAVVGVGAGLLLYVNQRKSAEPAPKAVVETVKPPDVVTPDVVKPEVVKTPDVKPPDPPVEAKQPEIEMPVVDAPKASETHAAVVAKPKKVKKKLPEKAPEKPSERARDKTIEKPAAPDEEPPPKKDPSELYKSPRPTQR